MKYLIAGLGNIGMEYFATRHNIGFQILDHIAEKNDLIFKSKRYGDRAQYKYKGRLLELLKPNTYMNLSGKAVNYWLQREKIPVENLLVLVDDIALPFGTLRLRAKGGNAGHNGLEHIEEILGHQNYARLRFGIGDNFTIGHQVNYVLSEWPEQEKKQLPGLMKISVDIVKSFVSIGIDRTMNLFNKKTYLPEKEKKDGKNEDRQMAMGSEDI